MRLTAVVFSTPPLKKFTNYKNDGYKYKVVRIPALKDEVKNRAAKPPAASCVNEMTQMMNCWKKTDFSATACSIETEKFLNCIAAAEVSIKEARDRAAKGLPALGSNLRPSRQVNEVLAQYPQPPSNFK